MVASVKSELKFGTPVVEGELDTYPGLDDVKYYGGTVVWTIPIQAPGATGAQPFEFRTAFTTCNDSSCDPPSGMVVKGSIQVGGDSKEPSPLKLEQDKYAEIVDSELTSWIDDDVPMVSSTEAPPQVAKTKPFKSFPTGDSKFPTRDMPSMDTPPGTEMDAESSHPSVSRVDSPELLAEMERLYKPDEKIKYLNASEMDQHPVGSGGSSSNDTTFWAALFGAFVGGMLLNLMPCVFPVLGLKVMGFVNQAGGEPGKIRMHGLAFTLGLLISMWILAGIILTLKSSLGWGAQLSSPYFVASIIVLLFLLGLNMAGVFEIGTSLTRVGGAVEGKEGYGASFFSGVITTLVATPCSGPFLGTAMSYALSQTAVVAMILFTVFALGIASPYLLFSFSPSLISKLPKPGAWMETFKVTMAFCLFATVAFFMQTFGALTGINGLSWLSMGLVVIGLAAYYYGQWSPPHVQANKRLLAGFCLPALILLGGGWLVYTASQKRQVTVAEFQAGGEEVDWQDWNPGKVEYLIKNEKKPVWVDYTADWCLTCKLNEQRIFTNDEVVERIQDLGVQMLVCRQYGNAQVHR